MDRLAGEAGAAERPSGQAGSAKDRPAGQAGAEGRPAGTGTAGGKRCVCVSVCVCCEMCCLNQRPQPNIFTNGSEVRSFGLI
jgi:hypothetical protein